MRPPAPARDPAECRVSMVQIQPRKHVLDRTEDYSGSRPAARARSFRDREWSKDLDREVGIDDLCDDLSDDLSDDLCDDLRDDLSDDLCNDLSDDLSNDTCDDL